MKDQLIFDTSDSGTIADSDSVGAFVRSSDGTLIDKATINSVERLAVDTTLKDGAGVALTSTLVGSDQALDVNMVNAISVDIDGIYNVGTNADPDNVGIIAHTRAATPGDSDQLERTTAGLLADALVNANIHALDVAAYGMSYNGATWDRNTNDGSGNLNVNVQAIGTITVNDAALANTAIANAATTLAVADTAELAVGTALANRKYLWVYNKHNQKIYLGSGTVTKANGFPVSPGSYVEMRAGAAITLNFIGETGKTPEIRTLELS